MDRIRDAELHTSGGRRTRRRAVAGVGLTAVLLAGAAGSALAATFIGDGRSNDIVGTVGADDIRGLGGDDDLYGVEGNDRIRGGAGEDDIEGGPGRDRIIGGPGEDDLYGGPGNDRIRAVDRHHDDIECGSGFDRVWANPGDDVDGDCERVIRRGATVRDGDGGVAAPPAGGPIGAQRAGEIAAAHVGGVVDDIERENDYGAYWEVDVYAPGGDYTVYVSATGEIVRVDRW